MKKPTLARDITLCLVVKALLLTLLWWMCYSHPVSDQAAKTQLSQTFQSTP